MDFPPGAQKLPIERGHIQWLAGVLGLYTLTAPHDPESLRQELPSLCLVQYPDETDLIREGDSGEGLFIIFSGKVRVLRGDRTVAELGSGALLGEIGFLTHKPRSATVRVDGGCEAFVIGSFEEFLEKHPSLRNFLQDLAGRRLKELQELARISQSEGPPPGAATDSVLPLAGPGAPAPGGERPGPAPIHPVPQPAVPLIAGRYALMRLVGRGGMGLVFLGHDRTLDRPVAIKQLREEVSKDPKVRRQFMEEARLQAQLSHPFIVGIHDIVDDASGMYLVFDFIDGNPISRLIRGGHRFSLGECSTVFHFVCQAVAFAHWHRVLHRDLKPSNIMIDRSGYAKVMDFGIARRVKDSLSGLSSPEPAGTPVFMAPEQHTGECLLSSDVYSLAVCLYEMLSGEIPFPGPKFEEQKRLGVFPPVSSRVRGLPAGVDELLLKALSPDPARRFPDAMSFLGALRRLCPE